MILLLPYDSHLEEAIDFFKFRINLSDSFEVETIFRSETSQTLHYTQLRMMINCCDFHVFCEQYF